MTESQTRPDLAALLADAAMSMGGEPNYDATLEAIVREAQKSIPGTDEAGLSLLSSGRIKTAAPSSDFVEHIDQFQYQFGEGPCLDAILEADFFRTNNMAAESRWPRFAPAAVREGVQSMLAFRLHSDGQILGALNLYSRHRDAFDNEAIYTGQPFAAHASIALSHSREKVQLLEALDNRDVIGMAKGILMERFKIDDERAFSLLVNLSQRSQEKLRTVASNVVAEARSAVP
ncbi:GAF and ANTAR domain-containing protein [Hoyosella subflava]|uniref:Two-component system response regulator n=1 Tax=Hoyosella subflava (strain DSM 45089 / JCM 17490 / NBRC 109087 / DQS3-9A1) TaxID=443218 RepID=F6ELZ1_HOYSD|nr:GAF and ANTAR domain-containing protein [Hoyosella subflava]AEF42772.1 Two-component system response regulator [Hoyosella subflava DQS3-9A1]